MEFQVFLVFIALSVSLVLMTVYGTESPGESYWKMNLGSDVSMPKVVKDALLDTKSNRAKQEYANGGQTYAQELSKVRTNSDGNRNYAKGAQAYAQELSKVRTNSDGNRNYAKGAQAYAQELSKVRTNSANHNYAKGAQAYAQELSKVRTNSANHNYAKVAQGYNSKDSELLADNSTLYFFEKDLIHPRSIVKVHFLMGAQKAKFMPSEVSKSIPFSSSKLPEILKYFAVKPGSQNAKIIEETITLCEGEEKSCETSLEGMVNYAKSKLGNQIKTVSTEVNEETEQEYQIKNAPKINNEQSLVCHKMVYPYAVFYCHTLSKTDIYDVSLVDSTGKKVRAVAVCHKDTSHWNEEHLAFKLLKVKPGSVPICHFLDADAMVWVPK